MFDSSGDDRFVKIPVMVYMNPGLDFRMDYREFCAMVQSRRNVQKEK